MEINTIIYCLDHPQLSGCLDCPHYMELDGSLFECRRQRISEARKIIEKYQKIQEIMSADLEHIHPLDRDKYIVASIKEVIKEADNVR